MTFKNTSVNVFPAGVHRLNDRMITAAPHKGSTSKINLILFTLITKNTRYLKKRKLFLYISNLPDASPLSARK